MSRLTLRKIFGFPFFLLRGPFKIYTYICFWLAPFAGWPMIYIYFYRDTYKERRWCHISGDYYMDDTNIVTLECTFLIATLFSPFGWTLSPYVKYWTISQLLSVLGYFFAIQWVKWSKECDDKYLNNLDTSWKQF